MSSPSRSRTPSSLKARLAVYSATAGAAMAATTANAAITNLADPGISINFVNTANVMLFSVGPVEAFLHFGNSSANYGFVSFKRGTGYGAIAGTMATAFNLPLGADFAPLNFLTGASGTGLFANVTLTSTGKNVNGSFASPGVNVARTGYIAMRAGAGAGLRFVWLRARVANTANGFPGLVSFIAKDGQPGVFGAWDYASSTTADGFKVGVTAPVPEPSAAMLTGLGLLALGAAGVREMRKRRQVQPTE